VTGPSDESARLGARPLLAVFGLALAVRAIVFFELRDAVLLDVLLGDAKGYVDWAREIHGGDWRGSEVFYQAPLYPYFIATVFQLTEGSLLGVRVLQWLLGSAACVWIAAAAARFFRREAFAREAGLAAGVLLALYPVAIFFDGIVQKTSLASFSMALLLFLVSRFDRVNEVRWPLLAGAVLGALILTRENALILLPVVGLWCLLPVLPGSPGERGMRLALFAAGAALILLPVGARNLSLGDEFLITTSQLGPNLYIGNHPGADGRYRALVANRGDVKHERHDAQRLAEQTVGRALTPAEVSDFWVAQVIAYMRDEPGAWLRLNLHKLWMVVNAEEVADTESLESYRDESRLLNGLAGVYHFGLLLPLAVLGVGLTRGRWRELSLLYAMALAMAAGVAAFFVMSRYRFPLVSILVIFAGVGVAGLAAALREEGANAVRSRRGPLLAAALALVFCNLPIGLAQQPRVLTDYNVAMALLEAERFELAQRHLEHAAAASVEPIVHLQLGAVLERRGDIAGAIDHYEAMLEARRADPARLRVKLIELHRGQGDEERARQLEAGAWP